MWTVSIVLTMVMFSTEGLINIIRDGRIREGGLKSGLVTENGLEEMARSWGCWWRRGCNLCYDSSRDPHPEIASWCRCGSPQEGQKSSEKYLWKAEIFIVGLHFPLYNMMAGIY